MEVGPSFRRKTFVLALVLSGVFCANAQQSNALTNSAPAAVALSTIPKPNHDLDDQHRIRPGDKLSFRVAEDREEAKTLPVTDSGEIELPYFGRFMAANKTCKSLAREIKVALEKEYYRHATVHIGLDAINNVRGQAFVSGQVAKQGPVSIPANSTLTVSQAILLAGPPTQWAKLNAVQVVRKAGSDTKTKTIDVESILNRGRIENDVAVEPDDLIIVPERKVVF